jgi:tetratricopeptide (TPR) repeat protein
MKKALSIFILSLGFFAFENIAYAQEEINKCWEFLGAWEFRKAIEAGKLAVEKYPKNSDAYYCLGEAYINVGELKLAYENMKKAESLTNNKKDLMYIYNKIGQILNMAHYSDDALVYYNKSLNLAKDLNNKNMQGIVLKNIADVYYYDKKEFDKALDYYEKSLKNLQTNKSSKAAIYTNAAFIYKKKGDYQKAVKYFQKAIEIDEEYESYDSVSINKLNIGNVYREMGDYSNAEKYLLEVVGDTIKRRNRWLEARSYRYLGWLYRDKGDKKAAKDYYNRAYNLFKDMLLDSEAEEVLNDLKAIEESK